MTRPVAHPSNCLQQLCVCLTLLLYITGECAGQPNPHFDANFLLVLMCDLYLIRTSDPQAFAFKPSIK